MSDIKSMRKISLKEDVEALLSLLFSVILDAYETTRIMFYTNNITLVSLLQFTVACLVVIAGTTTVLRWLYQIIYCPARNFCMMVRKAVSDRYNSWVERRRLIKLAPSEPLSTSTAPQHLHLVNIQKENGYYVMDGDNCLWQNDRVRIVLPRGFQPPSSLQECASDFAMTRVMADIPEMKCVFQFIEQGIVVGNGFALFVPLRSGKKQCFVTAAHVIHSVQDKLENGMKIQIVHGQIASEFKMPAIVKFVRSTDLAYWEPPNDQASHLQLKTADLCAPSTSMKIVTGRSSVEGQAPSMFYGRGEVALRDGLEAFGMQHNISTIHGDSGAPAFSGRKISGMHIGAIAGCEKNVMINLWQVWRSKPSYNASILTESGGVYQDMDLKGHTFEVLDRQRAVQNWNKLDIFGDADADYTVIKLEGKYYSVNSDNLLDYARDAYYYQKKMNEEETSQNFVDLAEDAEDERLDHKLTIRDAVRAYNVPDYVLESSMPVQREEKSQQQTTPDTIPSVTASVPGKRKRQYKKKVVESQVAEPAKPAKADKIDHLTKLIEKLVDSNFKQEQKDFQPAVSITPVF